MFRNLADRFRAIYNDHRDDHALLRLLSHCPGTFEVRNAQVHIGLWLPGRHPRYRQRAINTLLRELSEEISREAPMPLRLQLLTGQLQL